ESKQKYRRLIAELLTSPEPDSIPTNSAPSNGDVGPTIDQVLVAYWDRHVVSYYIKHGKPTSERDNIRQALRFVHRLHGGTPASDFGPQALKTVRQTMIDAGRCRNLINKDVNRIRGAFRWAVEHELLPLPVYQALVTVTGLRKDRTAAKERPPVRPVREEHIEAVLPHVSPTVATMIRVQRLTGMRPQEVILMRAVDIDTSDPACWVYRPHRSKGEHHDRDRVVYFGPRCQELLRPYLEHDPGSYMFSPRRAEARRRAELGARRKRPLSPAQQARRPKADPERAPGDLYDGGAYRKAIRRVCKKLGIPIWFPHQLRHSAATEFRRRFGLEASQAVLGHSELGTTQIYAEVDRTAARRVMTEVG
ncbi:MAG: site-specific integrase, partial [Isosphaeraceae bacterium]